MTANTNSKHSSGFVGIDIERLKYSVLALDLFKKKAYIFTKDLTKRRFINNNNYY